MQVSQKSLTKKINKIPNHLWGEKKNSIERVKEENSTKINQSTKYETMFSTAKAKFIRKLIASGDFSREE